MDRFARAGAAVERLCRLMAKLRAPSGCPWDREQTFESLKAYLLEECYEALEVMGAGQPQQHCEELGDLLLQIVFQAEIAAEERLFDMERVAEGIVDKLVRRHPHVFAGSNVQDPQAALQSWEAAKAAESPTAKSRLDGVPRALPSLLRALRIGDKAASIGFDWPDVGGVRAKVEEEWRELTDVMDAADSMPEALKEELGDLLLTIASLARHLGIDPEDALRQATEKFGRRFRCLEARMPEAVPTSQSSLDLLESMWEDAKSRERE